MNITKLRRSLLALTLVAGVTTAQQDLLAQAFGGARAGGAARGSAATAYPSSTEMGTAQVSVDLETRKVFVVTDDETATYVERVIKDIDRETPQVLIKCVFLEATYSDDLDVGVQGIYQYTQTGSSIEQFNGNATAGTALNVAAQAGGFYTFAGNGLDVTISALAKAGKTEILSRPSILARNNQPATISLGQQVPLITNTRFDNFGNQINTVSYTDVGIILSVTPYITPDDLVEMLVSPQISQLTDRSQWVPISGGGTNTAGGVVAAPVINSRSADTVVVVPNGETVVIGGLMQNTKLDSTEKVPLLGDIPLLGMLFRHKVKNDAKTELMIFLTPHIVRRPSDLIGLTTSERAEKKITPKAFSEEQLQTFLGDKPTVEEPAE